MKQGILADEPAITRLVCALLLKQNEEWAVQRRRYLTLETMAPGSDDPIVTLPTLAGYTTSWNTTDFFNGDTPMDAFCLCAVAAVHGRAPPPESLPAWRESHRNFCRGPLSQDDDVAA